MNRKIIILTVIFLLLAPFRLPIAVLFISGITSIAGMTHVQLNADILAANVVVTKLIYNLVLTSISIYTLEKLTRSIKGRNTTDSSNVYWTTVLVAILLVIYLFFDIASTHSIYMHIYG